MVGKEIRAKSAQGHKCTRASIFAKASTRRIRRLNGLLGALNWKMIKVELFLEMISDFINNLKENSGKLQVNRIIKETPALIKAIKAIKTGARTTHYGCSEYSYIIQFIIKQIVFTALIRKLIILQQDNRPIVGVFYLSSINAI